MNRVAKELDIIAVVLKDIATMAIDATLVVSDAVVGKIDLGDTQLVESFQLSFVRNTILVGILPNAHMLPHRIVRVKDTVAIPTRTIRKLRTAIAVRHFLQRKRGFDAGEIILAK